MSINDIVGSHCRDGIVMKQFPDSSRNLYPPFIKKHWEILFFFFFCGLMNDETHSHFSPSSPPIKKVVESDALVLHDFPSLHSCMLFFVFFFSTFFLGTCCQPILQDVTIVES